MFRQENAGRGAGAEISRFCRTVREPVEQPYSSNFHLPVYTRRKRVQNIVLVCSYGVLAYARRDFLLTDAGLCHTDFSYFAKSDLTPSP